jgi:hypothetical protein
MWEENIKMDLRETGCEDVDWIHLAQNRDQWRVVVNMGTIRGREILDQLSNYPPWSYITLLLLIV